MAADELGRRKSAGLFAAFDLGSSVDDREQLSTEPTESRAQGHHEPEVPKGSPNPERDTAVEVQGERLRIRGRAGPRSPEGQARKDEVRTLVQPVALV